MKNRLLKLSLGISLCMGSTSINAKLLDDKMTRHITHSIPWVEVRLAYSMTTKELAHMYYGNSQDARIILKANKYMRKDSSTLRKNMTVRIPVTSNFKDQPERLGWRP
jgi:hypothetical protein